MLAFDVWPCGCIKYVMCELILFVCVCDDMILDIYVYSVCIFFFHTYNLSGFFFPCDLDDLFAGSLVMLGVVVLIPSVMLCRF